MKLVVKSFIVSLMAVLAAGSALAEPLAQGKGELRLEPKIMHKAPITGQLELMFDGDAFKQVVVKLDKPIFGRSEFHSVSQWLNRVEANGKQQLALAYQLLGPSHSWYFVLVAGSNEGLTYDGVFYRVDSRLADIQAALKSGIPFTGDGKPVAPPRWTVIGTGTVKF